MNKKNFLVLLIFVSITLFLFLKTFVRGSVPIPFTLLVTWFFPYNRGAWEGHLPGLPIPAGLFAGDTLRQLYPWRILAMDLLKQGQFPWWNPYSLSGTPLFANIQTATLYPLNILFFLTDNVSAWTIYIISSIPLALIFMYLFLRSLKLSIPASLIGCLAFALSTHQVSWLEWGVISHSVIWLPLILFALVRFRETQQKRYLFILIFAAAITVFAGYPQKGAYVFLIAFLFSLYLKPTSATKKFLKHLIIALIAIILITAVQTLPTFRLFHLSALKGEVSRQLFLSTPLHLKHLATLFSPNFFGSRVNHNFWADQFSPVEYNDYNLFIGSLPFFLSLVALFSPKKYPYSWFFIVIALVGLSLAFNTPLTQLLAQLPFPVLATGVAARASFISIFALAVLAGIGAQILITQTNKRFKLPFLIYLGSLVVISAFTLTQPSIQQSVALKNLGFAYASLFLILIFGYLLFKKLNRHLILTIFSLFTFFELSFFFYKTTPFSPRAFAFPQHPLINFLQHRHDYYRLFGFWESEIPTNLETQFRLYSTEGYNPLNERRYSQLLAASATGDLPTTIPRSDADIDQKNETNRNRLLDLLAVKYIPAQVTDARESWEQEPLKYDPDRFKLIWQETPYKVYENLNVCPRVGLYQDIIVESDPTKIIKIIFRSDFNPCQTLILEEKFPLEIGQDHCAGQAMISDYQPNQVTIKVSSTCPQFLLLSDAFYPSWHAYLDGESTKIFRADYALRAIIINEGNHEVVFKYQFP